MEHVRLCEEKLSLLREISGLLASTDSVRAIANLILDLAVNYTGARKGSIMIVSELGDIHILSARGIDIRITNSYRARLGEGIAGVIAKAKTPVLIEDIRLEAGLNNKRTGIYNSYSFISCPILHNNRLLGLFNVSDKQNNEPFTTGEFDLLQIIANQAAIFFENAFLMDRLKTKAADLEEMGKKLANSDALRANFLRRVSHELRSPLNAINGAVYYLRSYEQRAESPPSDFYDIISSESSKLISNVENMLDYLWIEGEITQIKKSVVDLPALVSETVNSTSLKGDLRRKNIDIKVDFLEKTSNIVGDKIKISQFFSNIITGLSHYLKQDDHIWITAGEDNSVKVNITRQKGHSWITVGEDNCVKVNITLSCSLPETLIANLFNWRYMFQAEESAATAKLYLAWKIAEIHGWDIVAENAKDAFTLKISMPQSEKQKIEALVDSAIGTFIDFIAEMLNVNRCSIMLTDELTGDLVVRNAIGLADETIKTTRIKVGEKIAGRVALEGKPLLVQDIGSDPRFRGESMYQYKAGSLMSIPLKIDGNVIGVINLTDKRTAGPFTARDLSILCTLGDRISHFIERLYSGNYREDEVKELVTSLDSLLAAVKKYVKKGTVFTDLTVRIMDALEAAEEVKGLALYASMIYDLGLTLIDENLLKKKEELSQPEMSILRVHPHTSVGLIDSFEYSDDVKKAILHHHEKYDGTGYPDRLKEEEIPFISRVLSVVDAFCSMRTDRPYRKAYTVDTAIEEIKRGAGSRFDPSIVKALDKALQYV